MISHLQSIGDPLIKQFKKENLQLIMDNNAYHSPEDSETDQKTGKRKITAWAKIFLRGNCAKMHWAGYLFYLPVEKTTAKQ